MEGWEGLVAVFVFVTVVTFVEKEAYVFWIYPGGLVREWPGGGGDCC